MIVFCACSVVIKFRVLSLDQPGYATLQQIFLNLVFVSLVSDSAPLRLSPGAFGQASTTGAARRS